MTESVSLARDIEAFLRETGVTESRLGRDILRDPCFVSELRSGRVVRQTTEKKIRLYMANQRAARAADNRAAG